MSYYGRTTPTIIFGTIRGDNGIWETQWSWDECYPRLLHRDEYWSQTMWPCCANIHDEGERQWWAWVDDMYSEGASPVAPFTTPIPWGKCSYSNGTHKVEGNFEWDDIYTDRYETKIELLTGGDPGVTNEALFRLLVAATTGSPAQAIPPAQLTALGKSAVPVSNDPNEAYGVIYKKLPDHKAVDATVSAPGDCYTYSAEVIKASFRIVRGSTNFTGTTHVTWAGVPFILTVELSPPIVSLSNIVWSIPGNIYQGFYISSPPGAPTNGWPVAVSTLTNETVIFGWASEIANAVVTVTARR